MYRQLSAYIVNEYCIFISKFANYFILDKYSNVIHYKNQKLEWSILWKLV